MKNIIDCEFQNRAASKQKEVIRDRRKLQNEQLHNHSLPLVKYCLDDQIKEIQTGGTSSTQGLDKNVHKILLGYPEWKKQFSTI
jgi:hypothetical protein